jgi:hypothetical protein
MGLAPGVVEHSAAETATCHLPVAVQGVHVADIAGSNRAEYETPGF